MRHSAPYPGGNRSDTTFFLPGTRIGRWTVLQDAAVRSTAELRTRVRCDCGDIFLVLNNNLRRGLSKSCRRCARRSRSDRKPILPGTRFGRWTVIEDLGVRGRHSHSSCRCDCGRIFKIFNTNLRSGTSPGCRFCARGGKTDWGKLAALVAGR